ncbi:MAG: hypothetical protein PHQ03_04490 [Methylococcales bacterium]|nr:hypothetical protein [Methylococcales bacterium]
MERLKAKLIQMVETLEKQKHDDVMQRLEDLFSVYPFNDYEFLISSLMGLGKISLDDYYELRDDYIARNMFLYIFQISAPRSFGEAWAQGHLKSLCPELKKPTKKLDADYSGQYDFLLDGKIKIEVKASRAVDFDSNEPLYVKALASDSTARFDMNFQQVKPACCDVFIWVGVWRDVIRYWVLSSDEVAQNKYYSTGQHRGNTGEGQIHLKESNIAEFSAFESSTRELVDDVRTAYSKQISQN